MAKKKTSTGIPNQKGAWAILLVPILVGLVARNRDFGLNWVHLPLTFFWIYGFCWFNTFGIWAKTSKAGRGNQSRKALVNYTWVCFGFGVAVLATGGLKMCGWIVGFAPFMAVALWLTYRLQERDLLSGLATVGAAALMGVCTYLVDPALLFASDMPLTTKATLAVFLALFCYFASTIFLVKTVIRKRGSVFWLVWSLVFHLGCLALAVLLSIFGLLGWIWVAFFAVTLASAVVFPVLLRLGKRVKPAHVGFFEVGMSVLATVFALI